MNILDQITKKVEEKIQDRHPEFFLSFISKIEDDYLSLSSFFPNKNKGYLSSLIAKQIEQKRRLKIKLNNNKDNYYRYVHDIELETYFYGNDLDYRRHEIKKLSEKIRKQIADSKFEISIKTKIENYLSCL